MVYLFSLELKLNILAFLLLEAQWGFIKILKFNQGYSQWMDKYKSWILEFIAICQFKDYSWQNIIYVLCIVWLKKL